MELRDITTRAQYRRYLAEAHRFMSRDPDPATPEGARFELLVLILEAYEKEHFRL